MIIGLCGLAQSGKNTAANFLLNHNIVHSEYAFAEPIKACVNALFGWNEDHAEGALKEVELDVEVTLERFDMFCRAWKKYGLDAYMSPLAAVNTLRYIFHIQPSKWDTFKALFNKYHQIRLIGRISPRKAYQLFGTEFGRDLLGENVWVDIAPTKKVVITDVRFPNEREWLRENGGVLVRINSNRETIQETGHVSEKHVKEFDVDLDIHNNGTLQEYEQNFMVNFAKFLQKKVEEDKKVYAEKVFSRTQKKVDAQ